MDEDIIADVASIIAGAILVEEFGIEFYGTLALGFEDVDANALFRYLKVEEEKHRDQLKDLQKRFDEPGDPMDFLPEDLFFDISDVLKSNDPVSILGYAVKLEKTNMWLYESWMESVEDQVARDTFEELVEFESEHVKMLEQAHKEFEERAKGS